MCNKKNFTVKSTALDKFALKLPENINLCSTWCGYPKLGLLLSQSRLALWLGVDTMVSLAVWAFQRTRRVQRLTFCANWCKSQLTPLSPARTRLLSIPSQCNCESLSYIQDTAVQITIQTTTYVTTVVLKRVILFLSLQVYDIRLAAPCRASSTSHHIDHGTTASRLIAFKTLFYGTNNGLTPVAR